MNIKVNITSKHGNTINNKIRQYKIYLYTLIIANDILHKGHTNLSKNTTTQKKKLNNNNLNQNKVQKKNDEIYQVIHHDFSSNFYYYTCYCR